MSDEHASTDRYLVTVGKLTQNATITDIVLFSAFKVMAECGDRVAQAIYYSLDSLAAKGRLARRVAVAAGDEQDAGLIDDSQTCRKSARPTQRAGACAPDGRGGSRQALDAV